jgi:hypothetical protein
MIFVIVISQDGERIYTDDPELVNTHCVLVEKFDFRAQFVTKEVDVIYDPKEVRKYCNHVPY